VSEHQAQSRRFQRDIEFYEAHRDQLLEQYPEQWVAIFNQHVAGVDPDVDRLLASLHERGIPTASALIEHLTIDDDLLVLPP
jgi:hypothetical protein